MTKALEIKHLKKSFGAVEVLKDINVEIEKGEFLVLVGPSGCGKSTLLNSIAGLEETTAGQILIDGRDVTHEPPRDRDIAMVFQSYALYPTMNVGDNIGFGMKIRNVEKATRDAKIQEVAQLLQIDHLLERKPSELSGGQRQRVAMGRALVRDPKLFLFDEPLSNLDAKLRVEMRAEIKKLHANTNASIVYVTHDQIEAMTLATKIVVLKGGIVQQVGTPAEIYFRPANTFVADFMGSPPMNLVPAQHDNGVITLPDDQRFNVPARLTQKDVVLGIRPEALQIDNENACIHLEANLTEHSGADCFANFAIGETMITARFDGSTMIEKGQTLPLNFDVNRLVFFDAETGVRLEHDQNS